MNSAGQLGLSLASSPAEDDQVNETEGARVFLAAEIAPLLDSQTLDVEVEAAGEPSFYLR
jgi:Fe-S cluster assembly iron-binding protein IscA